MSTAFKAVNDVKETTQLSDADLINIYGLPPGTGADVLPVGRHNMGTPINWDTTVKFAKGPELEVSKEAMEFMKQANTLVNGKLKYGHVIGYKEAIEMVDKQKLAPALGQSEQMYAKTSNAVNSQAIEEPNKEPVPIPVFVSPRDQRTRQSVIFTGPFGKLRVQYDEAFVSDIYLVLANRAGSQSDYEPPEATDQAITIQVGENAYDCFSGPRFSWPDGSISLAIFLIEAAHNGKNG